MSDYASIIGGAPGGHIGEAVDLHSVPNSWDAYYHIESANVFIDRFHSSGNNIVDAVDNHSAVHVETGSGRDIVYAGYGDDSIWAGAGDDVVNAGSGNNTVSGGAGKDVIMAGAGNDVLSGGSEDDTIMAGAGNDSLLGGTGDDMLAGGVGNDTLDGGTGNDTLLGDAGDDYLMGAQGDDTLAGGAGNDTLSGGTGHDSFDFSSGFGHDVITDLAVGDKINLSANINGTGITSAADLVNHGMISGGTTASGTKFTVITIGTDTIRLEKMDAVDFVSHINSWVHVG